MSQVTIWSSSILSYQLNNVHIVQCMQWWIAMEMVNLGWISGEFWMNLASIIIWCLRWPTKRGKLWPISISSNLDNWPASEHTPEPREFPRDSSRVDFEKKLLLAPGNFPLLFKLLLCCGCFLLRIIFQTEFHLTLLISHSSSLLPLSARNWQVLERELFKREGSIYPSIHLICHPQSNSWNM